jgi:alanine racemase
MRPTFAILKTENLFHNIEVIKKLAPNSKIVGMIKANGYGHGIRSVALRIHDKIDILGVSSIDEGLILRKIGIKSEILLMQGVYSSDEMKCVVKEKFQIIIHHEDQIQWLLDSIDSAGLIQPINVWLKIDTGMGRLGFKMNTDEEVDQIKKIYFLLKENKNVVKPIKIISHFACADEINHPLNQIQIQNFEKICSFIESDQRLIEKSLCNSAGIINFPDHHYNYVRPGLMMYGLSPIEDELPASFDLKPVIELESQVIAIKNYKKGDGVGYGSTFICDEDKKIGIVPIGYGDGYTRTFKNGTPILVNDKICKLVGRVSMDMITVDLTHLNDVRVHDRVVFFGEKIPLNMLIKYSNCCQWDLLTQLQVRIPFKWI